MVTAAAIGSWPAETDVDARAREDLGDAPAPVMRGWGMQQRVVPALVPRQRLVRDLSDIGGPPVALLAAPAGFGKTTLLLQWSERDPRPFAWLTLDERDNDPRRMLSSVRRAVTAATGGLHEEWPFVLVLDDVHALHDRRAIAALGMIATDLPPHAKLAIASRTEPELPIARMLAQRDVTMLGPRDLAMTSVEAAALLKAAGQEVGREQLDALLARTEGWPAALSLASLFLADRGAGSLTRFGGADRLVRQYVRDEVLSCLPLERREFMLRTSIAGTMTAPLCDALVGRPGSAATLAALARAGLAVPLDCAEERYRYHRLLSESLRAELRHAAPELEPALHRRASAWHRGACDIDRAIDHALSAGAIGAAADLVWSSLAPVVAEGRTSTVEGWLSRFTESEIADHATLALTAAGCALLRGQGHLAEHWTTVADATRCQTPAVRSGVAVLRAAIRNAEPSRPDESRIVGGGWQFEDAAAGCALHALIDGMGRRLVGDRDGAATALEAGARRAAIAAPAIQALCLAELGVLALEEDDWERAAELVTRARAQVDRHGLKDHAAMALVFAVSALVRAYRGRVDSAQADLREAARLQALFTDFPPYADAEVALLVARAALRLSDVSAAREQLAAAKRLLRGMPNAIALHVRAEYVAAQLDAFTTRDSAPPSSMTGAELRILQYLPTHLSFREIGELSFVSSNTVKTQAIAVYRKLGVSCRSEAVARARGCGLLDGA